MTGSFVARKFDLSTPRSGSLHAARLASLPIALLLLLLAVGTAAAGHHGALTRAVVTPRSATAGSTVDLAVTYSNRAGRAPASVVALVGRTSVPMTAASGDVKTGLRFVASMVPLVGRHAVTFIASDKHEGRVKLEAGYVVVALPAESTAPPPKARVTAPPISRGKQDPDTGTNPVARATAAPDPAATAAPAPLVPDSGDPEAPDLHLTAATDSAAGTSAVGQLPVAIPTSAAEAADAATSGDGSGRGSVGSGSSDAATSPVAPAGIVDPLEQYRHAPLTTMVMEMLPAIATATSGGAAWAAFVLFGKRRRDGDDDNQDTQLAGAAASGVETGAAQGFNVVDESQMPRWRRPSLQQVRRADPLRQVAEAAPTLSFEGAGVHPLESRERRSIGYRLVRLLDSPDEVRAAEIGILDRGDEVQLLERYGVYWRVLCPDGRTGWVHRMTLTDPTVEQGQAAPATEQGLEDVDRAALVQGAGEGGEPAKEQAVDGFLNAYLRAHDARDGQAVSNLGPVPRESAAAAPFEATAEPVEIAEPEPIAEVVPPSIELPRRSKTSAPRPKTKLTLRSSKKPAEPVAQVEGVAEPVVEVAALVEPVAPEPVEIVELVDVETAAELPAEPIKWEAVAQFEPLAQAEAVAEPVELEPVAEAVAEPIRWEAVAQFEPLAQAEAVAQFEPLAQAVAEPVELEPIAEAVAEPVELEPIAEAVAEPVELEPIAEAVAEPVELEPIAEAVAEPVQPEPVAPVQVTTRLIIFGAEEVEEAVAVAEPVLPEQVELVQVEAVAEPVVPEPVEPEPVEFEAVEVVQVEAVAEPVVPEPVELVQVEAVAEPVVPEPVEPEPVEPEPVEFEAVEVVQVEAVAEPVVPEPVEPEPVLAAVPEQADPHSEHAGLSAAERAVAMAHDYLEQAGFLVQAPHDPAQADIPIFAPVFAPDEAEKLSTEPAPEAPAEPS